jgi:hypothetical protein
MAYIQIPIPEEYVQDVYNLLASLYSIKNLKPELLTFEEVLQWTQIENFNFKLVNKECQYEKAYKTKTRIGDRVYDFIIAYTSKISMGRLRKYIQVFLIKSNTNKPYPVVELVGADDYDNTHQVLGTIKGANGKLIKEYEIIPLNYKNLSPILLSNRITGPYTRNTYAIVISEDDKNLLLRHAIFRAKDKKLI